MNKTHILLLTATLLGLTSQSTADTMDRFCANVEGNRFVANPRSCHHWIFCQDQRATTEGTCTDEFYFDESKQMCRYPEFVDCPWDNVGITCDTVDDLTLHPHPDNCGQYVACVNGFPTVQECAPGLHWDTENLRCDTPANSGCTSEPELNYTCEPGQTYVTHHPHDCQKFIVCVNGDRRLNRCADELLWDRVEGRCDFAANVQCLVDEEDVDYECDPNRDFYFAPHPTSCNVYFLCFAGTRQLERCAPGLEFDWIDLNCQLAGVAICLAPRLV